MTEHDWLADFLKQTSRPSTYEESMKSMEESARWWDEHRVGTDRQTRFD